MLDWQELKSIGQFVLYEAVFVDWNILVQLFNIGLAVEVPERIIYWAELSPEPVSLKYTA
jgi:hypothetical protein